MEIATDATATASGEGATRSGKLPEPMVEVEAGELAADDWNAHTVVG